MSVYKAPDGSKYNIPTEPLQRKRFVDAVKNNCYKWGACDAEFMWQKYNDEGGYSDDYQLPAGFSKKLDKEKTFKKS